MCWLTVISLAMRWRRQWVFRVRHGVEKELAVQPQREPETRAQRVQARKEWRAQHAQGWQASQRQGVAMEEPWLQRCVELEQLTSLALHH